MSLERKVTVTCRKCGAESEAAVFDSINTEINPGAKQKVIDGSLFQHKCDKCGNVERLNYTTLFHDVPAKLMIYYASCESDFAEIRQSLRTLHREDNPMRAQLKGYTTRLVVSQNALMEKALIFDLGLDDKIIEIIKAVYCLDAMEKYPELEIDELLFFVDEGDKYALQFLANKPLTGEIDKKLYREIAANFRAKIDAKGSSDIIDIRWALDILK